MPKPFVKWAGGKTSLLPELLERIPDTFSRYFEPFVGGGALFFALNPKKGCLTDINEELINLYYVIKTDVDRLIKQLSYHRNDESYYYDIRNKDREPDFKNWTPLARASRMLYLNKTCWNGLYRVNSSGYFNVPFGDYKNPSIFDESNLRECSRVLENVELGVGSFERVEQKTSEGDFVYFDPPYAPLDPTSFTSYAKDDFGEKQQIKLKELCDVLTCSNVKFMLSNSYNDFILDLYKGYRIDTVLAPRYINSKGDGRGKVKEVLVMNYEQEINKDWWEIGD